MNPYCGLRRQTRRRRENGVPCGVPWSKWLVDNCNITGDVVIKFAVSGRGNTSQLELFLFPPVSHPAFYPRFKTRITTATTRQTITFPLSVIPSGVVYVRWLFIVLLDIVIMRWSVLSTLALLVVGTVASPVKEESSMTVDVAEIVTAEDSHFIVSVQRYISLVVWTRAKWIQNRRHQGRLWRINRRESLKYCTFPFLRFFPFLGSA